MDIVMIIGIALIVVGLFLQIINAKWSWSLGGYYRSKNRSVSYVKWLLILVGLLIIIVRAYMNGQLG